MDKIGASLSPPRRSNLLVGLIIFFSATQLGLHFWPLSSLVYGIRIDYLSPTIYFLDILIILFLVIKRSDLVGCKPNQKPTRSDLVGVIPILLINLLYSANPLSTLSWSLHFLLYFLFLRTVLKRNAWLQAKQGSAAAERTVLNGTHGTLRFFLTLTLLFQALLAAAQVSLGHSLGGLFYWLGERSVAVGSPAVALATFMGRVVLRAYGTFGHPNALAGWSVVCLLILIQISQTATPKVSKKRVIRGSDPLRKSWLSAKMFSRLQNTIGRPGQTLWVLITILIVFLTHSRAAALSLFAIIIPLYLIKNLKLRLFYYFIALLLYSSVFPSFLSPLRSDFSLTQRLDLQGLSLKVIVQYPLFGTGTQASISTYPNISPSTRLLQPDHNSFTLFLSWFGLFGVLAIIQILPCTSSAKAREKCLQTLRSLGGLLPLLLLDHYFLTSPQGLFILMLYFKLAVNYSHAQNNH